MGRYPICQRKEVSAFRIHGCGRAFPTSRLSRIHPPLRRETAEYALLVQIQVELAERTRHSTLSLTSQIVLQIFSSKYFKFFTKLFNFAANFDKQKEFLTTI